MGDLSEDTPRVPHPAAPWVLVPPARDGTEQCGPSSPPPGARPPLRAPARGCREGFRAEMQLLQKQTPQKAFGEAAGAASLPNVPAGNRLAGEAETVLPTRLGWGKRGWGRGRWGLHPTKASLGPWSRAACPHCHLPPPKPRGLCSGSPGLIAGCGSQGGGGGWEPSHAMDRAVGETGGCEWGWRQAVPFSTARMCPHFPQLVGDVREIKSQQETSASSRVTEAARRSCSNEAARLLPSGSGCPENATRSREALPASDAGSAFP